jgi:hypothetical protein
VRASWRTVGPRLRSPALLAGGFVLVDVVAASTGGLGYPIDAGSLGRTGPVALVTTAVIALMGLSIASYAAEVVPGRSALLAMGRAWKAVLLAHAVVLFAVDAMFAAAGVLPRADLHRAAETFRLDRLWLLYLVPALAAPVLLDLVVRRLAPARPDPEAAP